MLCSYRIFYITRDVLLMKARIGEERTVTSFPYLKYEMLGKPFARLVFHYAPIGICLEPSLYRPALNAEVQRYSRREGMHLFPKEITRNRTLKERTSSLGTSMNRMALFTYPLQVV